MVNSRIRRSNSKANPEYEIVNTNTTPFKIEKEIFSQGLTSESTMAEELNMTPLNQVSPLK